MTGASAILVICLGFAISACGKAGPSVSQELEPARSPSPTSEKSKRPLSEIDISRIGHIAPKGRVQDKDYNELEVVDQLIANGKDAIPFLIARLDDRTVIQDHVMDFWPKITVGDVAFIILSDFSMDSSWKKRTIPGTDFSELFETKSNPNIAFWEEWDTQLRKHGRHWLKAKWQNIWTTYKDRIVWDEQERCFKVV